MTIKINDGISKEHMNTMIEDLIALVDSKEELTEAQYIYLQDKLHKITNTYVTVDDQGKTVYMDVTTRDITSPTTIMNLINNREVSISASIKNALKSNLIPSNILQHVVGTVFEPASRSNLVKVKGHVKFNTYTPPQIKPVEGDVNPFLTYIDCLTLNEGDAAKEHLLDWLAHLIQKPHERTLHGIYLYGDEKGNGKSTLSKVIATLLGSKHVENTNTKIVLGNFDDYRKDKLIVQIDDVDAGNTALDTELKSLSTLDRCTLNIKGGKQLNDYPNLVRFIVTTNEPVGMKMEEGDRRWFCLNVSYLLGDNKEEHLKNRAILFNDLNAMLNCKEGVEALYYYLSTRDVSNFEPMSPAPMTNFKKKLQGNTLLDESGDFAESLDINMVLTPDAANKLWKLHGQGKSVVKRNTTLEKLGFSKRKYRYILDNKPLIRELWMSSDAHNLFSELSQDKRGYCVKCQGVGVIKHENNTHNAQPLQDGACESSQNFETQNERTHGIHFEKPTELPELEDETEY